MRGGALGICDGPAQPGFLGEFNAVAHHRGVWDASSVPVDTETGAAFHSLGNDILQFRTFYLGNRGPGEFRNLQCPGRKARIIT